MTVYPADVVLFEGILAFYSQEVRDLFRMKLFVDTDADTRLSRRGEARMCVVQQGEKCGLKLAPRNVREMRVCVCEGVMHTGSVLMHLVSASTAAWSLRAPWHWGRGALGTRISLCRTPHIQLAWLHVTGWCRTGTDSLPSVSGVQVT